MSLHKIWLILRSEYWRRVRSKTFLLATLLVPVGMVILAAAPAVLGHLASQSDRDLVAVVDETGEVGKALVATSDERITFRSVDQSIDSVRAAVRAGTYDGYLKLPKSLLTGDGRATYYSLDGGGLTDRVQIDRRVGQMVQQARLQALDASDDVLSVIENEVPVASRTLSEDGAESDHSLAYTAIGYVMALVIYFAVFIYGQLVMQGVIEEKSNRVVEIIVSSARPFELLMGKVLGIGAMGMTQMLAWCALVLGGVTFAAPLLGLFLDASAFEGGLEASPEALAEATGIAIPSIPASLVLWFLLFFLGGFLLYAALFAAVGSAVERQQDAQNLLLLILTPLLIPLLFLAFVLESPNATVSVVLAQIPFFSPILMPLRAAITSLPVWEIALAYGLLVAGFVGMIWVAGRIYRIGILSYGKTPGVREILRWVTYR